ITSRLVYPLKANYLYKVSFYVYRTDYSNYAIGNIGALFSEEPLIIKEDKQYEPQVLSASNQLFSKNSWVKIEDTLQAKGEEAFITLGNFDQYRNKFIRKLHRDRRYQKKFNFNRAYYYLDQVSVIELGPAPVDTVPRPPDEIEEVLVLKGGIKINLGKPIILDQVFFDFDKAVLLPDSFEQLDELVNFLIKYPAYQAEIIGHTDSIGTIQKNQGLSLRRAQAVADYLVAHDVAEERLVAQGLGEIQPIASNANAEGRQLNRRVEMIIRKKE
ncbi:MAG: OmpA family protein, partial [Bacteroidota bacterium]